MSQRNDRAHVLIFAPYFPPRLRVGAIRPYRFAKYLSEEGWKVTVVCIQDSNNELTVQEKNDLGSVQVIELETPVDNTQKNQKKKEQSPKKNHLAEWVDRNFPLDTWLPFFWYRKKEILDIFRDQAPDVVFSTSDPWSGGYIAGKYAKKLGLKWVADFRDPWTICSVRFPEKGSFARMFEKRAEQWIVNHVDFMTFTAEVTEQKYIEHYPQLRGKTATVYNSFDLDVHEVIKPERKHELMKEGQQEIHVLFLGSFRKLSTAESLIGMLAVIRDKAPDVYEMIRIHSYGELEGTDLKLAKESGVDDRFITRSKVPNNQIQDEFDKADLLWLSTHPERDDIVPAKLFDYLISGRPVLSVLSNPEVKDVLKDTKTGVQFHPDAIEEAADYLIGIAEKGEVDFDPDLDAIQSYDAKHRADELSEILKEVMDHG